MLTLVEKWLDIFSVLRMLLLAFIWTLHQSNSQLKVGTTVQPLRFFVEC